jgi:hypothetical protein
MKLFIAIAVAIGFYIPIHVNAQTVRCIAHEQMVQGLKDAVGEKLVWHGLTQSGHTVRLYMDHQDGSWSATAQGPGGPECFNAIGSAATKIPYEEKYSS